MKWDRGCGQDGDMRIQKRTGAERRRLVELYVKRASGVTRREFCRMHSIAPSTLDYWRRTERRAAAGKLIPVQLTTGNPLGGFAGVGFKLRLANGRRIETHWGFADDDLARLIRVAESV